MFMFIDDDAKYAGLIQLHSETLFLINTQQEIESPEAAPWMLKNMQICHICAVCSNSHY
jgi:hypothetical protein